MKTLIILGTGTITAAANLVKNRFIGFDGNYCGANQKALGVSEADTDSGKEVPVILNGIALVETGGAVSAGNAVTSDGSGRAVAVSNFSVDVSVTVPAGETPMTSNAAQPNLVETVTLSGGVLPIATNGYALDSASGAGEIIRVKLI